MKKLYSLLTAILIAIAAIGQNVNVNSGEGSYATLSAAFTAINNGVHTGIISIRIEGDITETTSATLQASGTGSSNYTAISIAPLGNRIIEGSIANSGLIFLSGADLVTIDGINDGTNSLIVRNSSNSSGQHTSTIRFADGACGNTVKNCTVQGISTCLVASLGGTISFGDDVVTGQGNNDNIISNNKITNIGTSANPIKAISSIGSTSNVLVGNSGNTISNNSIYSFSGVSNAATSGIYIGVGNTFWTISGNKIYQPSTITVGTGNVIGIEVNSSNITTGAQGFSISGNIIGYASNTQTGIFTMNGSAGTGKFYGISYSGTASGASTTISDNIIAGISRSCAAVGTGSTGPFTGINVISGSTTVTGNTIGSQSVSNSISFTSSGSSSSEVYGIYNTPSNWTCSNNSIGGISVTFSNASAGVSFQGIRYINSGGQVTNNTVGGTTAGSISVNQTSSVSTIFIDGINISNNVTVTGNTVRNLTHNKGVARGIVAVTGCTVNSNTIYDISSTATTPNTLVTLGIQVSTGGTTSMNTIYGLSSPLIVRGISGSGAIDRNTIYGLKNTGTTLGSIAGVNLATLATCRNNMITLGNEVSVAIGSNSTITSGIFGIFDASNSLVYHNSVYIGGSATTGAGNCFAYASSSNGSRTCRDNIFYNVRTYSGSATGKAFAVGLISTGNLTLNNNLYRVYGASEVFGRNTSTDQDLATWKSANLLDASSIFGDPQFIDPTGSVPNLHLHATNPTIAEGNGFNVGVNGDFDNESRSGLTPTDIGADAGDFVSGGDFSAPVVTYTTLADTSSTDNRTLTVTLVDNFGVSNGGNDPRLYFNKNGGQFYSTALTLSSGTVTNGSWTATFDYSLLGGVTAGDVVRYYVVAQDAAGYVTSNPATGFSATDVNTIVNAPTSPSSFKILRKFNGTYTVGSGGDFTTLTNSGGAFEAFNAGVFTGNVTLNVVSDISTETGSVALGQWVENGGSNFTLLIKPSGGARTISGSINNNPLISLGGADRVTIDGSTNGSSAVACKVGGTSSIRELTICNTATTGASVFGLVGNSNQITLKNLIITGPATGATYGLYLSGFYNDDLRVENCSVKRAAIGIYTVGNSSVYNNNSVYTQNDISGTASDNTVMSTGIQLIYENNAEVSYNNIDNLFPTSNTNAIGMILGTGLVTSTESAFTGQIRGAKVFNNRINSIKTNNPVSAVGIALYAEGAITSTISNNTITGIFSSPGTASLTTGIYLAGFPNSNIALYNNSVALTGERAISTQGRSFALAINSTSLIIESKDNIFYNTQTIAGGATTPGSYAVGANSTASKLSFNYNNYYSRSGFVFGAITNLGGNTYTSLSTWQSSLAGGTGADAASTVAIPPFVNASKNLALGMPFNSGVAISGLSTDHNCSARPNPPTMGAYEVKPTVASSLNFDGANDYVALPSAINLANRSFTIECYAKRSVSGSNDWMLTNYAQGTNNGLYMGFRSNDEFTFAFYANDLNISGQSDNNWHHWACVYNKDIASGHNRFIYKDGVLVGSDRSTGDYSGSAPFSISYPSDPFSGSIDEMRIWSTALSAADIQERLYCEVNPNGKPNLLALYHFNQGMTGSDNSAVASLTDATSNHYNGTLSNFALNGYSSNWAYEYGVESDVVCIDLPKISAISDQSTCRNIYVSPINFTVSDGNGDNVTITATSSNTALVSNANITFNTNGTAPGERIMNIKLNAGQIGTTTITLTPNDGTYNGTPVSFILTSGITLGNLAPTVFTSGFSSPYYLTLDASENLYVSEYDGGKISKITPAGTKSTFASVANPVGLTMDKNGNIFCSESLGSIVKITPAGVKSLFATGFGNVHQLTFDKDGNLYVGQYGASALYVISPAGSISSVPATFNMPMGVAIDKNTGDIYVAEFAGNVISKVTTSGVKTTYATGISGPSHLIFDDSNNLIVSSYNSNKVIKISPSGTQTDIATSISNAVGAIYKSNGDLYISGKGNGNIYKLPAAYISCNTKPVVSEIDTQRTCDNEAKSVIFYVNDGQQDSLTITATSSNTTLLPNANVVVSYGSGSTDRGLTLTPATDQVGSTTITVTVNDGVNDSVRTFVLEVGLKDVNNSTYTICNSKPVFNPTSLDNDTLCFSTSNVTLANRTIAVSDDGSIDTTTVSSSDPSLIAVTNSGTNTNVILNLIQKANKSGSATITVTSTDDFGGSSVLTFSILVNKVVATPSSTNVSCNAGTDGSMGVTVPTGGTAPYSYTWSGSFSGSAPTTRTVSNVSAGNYSLLITDSKGCEASYSFTITQPDPLLVTPTQNNVSCFGLTDGSASVSVSGGTPGYAYSWSGQASGTNSTNTLSNQPAGTYTVTINDAYECTTTATFVITAPNEIMIDADPEAGEACDGGSTTFTVETTNTTALKWQVNDGNGYVDIVDGSTYANSVSSILTVNATLAMNGYQYRVKASQSSTCFTYSGGASLSVLTCNTAPEISSFTAIDQCTGINREIDFTITDSEGDGFTVSAVSSNTSLIPTPTITSLGGSNYRMSFKPVTGNEAVELTVKAVDIHLASSTSVLTVTVKTSPEVSFPALDPLCVNSKDISLNTATPAGGVYSGPGVVINGLDYDFSPATSGAGNHTLSYAVSAINGCTGTAKTVILVNNLPTITLADFEAVCLNTPAFMLKGGSPSAGTYAGNGVANGKFDPAVAGVGTTSISFSYTRPSTGCTNSIIKTIEVKDIPTVVFADLDPLCSNATDMQLSASPAGGTFSGTGVIGSLFSPSLAGAGTYSLAYTYAENGCSVTDVASVTVNALPVVSQSSFDAVCQNAFPIVLSGGSPAGGSYSGEGVEDGKFYADRVSVGEHIITYSYTNGLGCTNSVEKTLVVNAATSLTLPDGIEICNNAAAITLTGVSPVGGSFSGDGITDYSFDPSVLSSGDHTITYTYANEFGCITSGDFIITVKALPEPVIIAAGNTAICEGSEVELTATNGFDSYQWMFNGSVLVDEETAAYSATQAGTYTVSVGQDGCFGVSNEIAVSTLSLPQPEISVPTVASFCSGSSLELGTTISYESYQWNDSNGAINGANSSVYDASIADQYSVTVTDANGCSATSSPVSVSASGGVVVSVLGSTQLCPNSSVVLRSSAASSYQWFKGNDLVGTDRDLTAMSASEYHVVATDAQGCESTSSVVNITQLNSEPSPLIALSGADEFCEGGHVTLATDAYSSYQWYKNGSKIPGAVFRNYQNSVSGSFTVMAGDANGCKAISEETIITVNPLPEVVLNVPTINSICAPDSLELKVQSGDNTYSWFRNNEVINGEVSNALQVSLTGLYRVDAVSAKGCAASSKNVLVNVKPAPQTPQITNPLLDTLVSDITENIQWYLNGEKIVGATSSILHITQNGTYTVEHTGSNGCSSFADAVNVQNLRVEGNADESWSCYPNPSNGELNISTTTTTIYELFDMTGKLVSSGKLAKGVNKIDLQSLPAGVYHLRGTNYPKPMIRVIKY